MPQPPDTNHQSILIPWEKQPYYAQNFPISKDKEKANKKAIGDQQSQITKCVFILFQKLCYAGKIAAKYVWQCKGR